MNISVAPSLLIPFIGGIYLLGVYLLLGVFQFNNSDKTI